MAPALEKWLYPKSERVAMWLILGRRVTHILLIIDVLKNPQKNTKNIQKKDRDSQKTKSKLYTRDMNTLILTRQNSVQFAQTPFPVGRKWFIHSEIRSQVFIVFLFEIYRPVRLSLFVKGNIYILYMPKKYADCFVLSKLKSVYSLTSCVFLLWVVQNVI